MKRGELLRDAAIIVEERNQAYGKPEDCFEFIAGLWSAYLREEILPEDVVNMMILLKVSREKQNHKLDNYKDIAGYSACGAELWHEIDVEEGECD